MPSVIITPAFAALRVREIDRKYTAIGQGIQNTADTIAQSILDYKTRQAQEENVKLHLVDNLIQQYGDQADPALLASYDKMLNKHGLSVPRDGAGRLLPPQPSNEFELFRESMRKGDPDGKLREAFVRKHAGEMSPLEQSFKEHDQEETRRYHDLEIAARNNEAQLRMLAAEMRNARAGGAGNRPSGYFRLADGSLAIDQGGDPPEGAVRLTHDMFMDQHRMRVQASLEKQRDINAKKTAAQTEMIKRQVGHDILFGDFKQLLPSIALMSKGALSPRQEKYVNGVIDKVLDKYGVPKEERQGFFGRLGSIAQGWLTLTPDQQKEVLSGVTIDPNQKIPEAEGGETATLTPPPAASKGGTVLGPGAVFYGEME